MNLYFISQTENEGYDTYDSAVVAAENEGAARHMQPGVQEWGASFPTWARSPDAVSVQYLGEADGSISAGVICSSFNAG